jgi:hypothetical protein
VGAGEFAKWVGRFEEERERRRALGDPGWERGATLHPAVWAGIQRFQVGEDGDGANLVAKADEAGDPDYARAVRLFVAEEQNHARLLALLLAAGGMPTLAGHWSDTVFVRLRRLMGLRLELLVLMIPVLGLWRLLLLAVTLVVAADHGGALARLGVGRLRFVTDVMASSAEVTTAILTPRPDAWSSG